MESWRQRINRRPYGRYKANAPCGRHPSHRQSPGVCSVCLNEKLSQLTLAAPPPSSRRKPAHSASSSSSYLSSLTSSDASSCSSPRARRPGGVLEKSGREVLRKSRSMAFFLRRSSREEKDGVHVESKGGFWWRLLQRGSKGLGLTYSRTMRERVVAGVH